MTNIESFIFSGESPFQSKVRGLDDFSKIVHNSKKPFFLYGASIKSEHLIGKMFKLDLLPKCICDSDVNKHGSKMLMLPVVSPEDAVKNNPGAVCAIGIRAIATCYNEIFQRLEAAGCNEYYIIDWDFCHYTVPDEWKSDILNNSSDIISCAERFDDALSGKRYEEFILSFLSGKVSARDCLASFKPKDGSSLKNDLCELSENDVVISCRCGLDRHNAEFIKNLKVVKQAHLLEPTLSGRIKTSELLPCDEDRFFLYPFFPSLSTEEVEFDERHCYIKYIDLEDFLQSKAPPASFDVFFETNPTVLYLDMTGHFLTALKSAERLLKERHPTIIITGFRLASEAAKIILAYPNIKWHMRCFGGQNMREGYALIGF